jgi:hypothetical protein
MAQQPFPGSKEGFLKKIDKSLSQVNYTSFTLLNTNMLYDPFMLYCGGLKKKGGTNHEFRNYDQNSLPDERKNCRENTTYPPILLAIWME